MKINTMSNKNKIYTKTGDLGMTSIIGGRRVLKNTPQLEAYGTIDELNSYIGLIRSQDIDAHTKDFLLKIQNDLFTIGALLATDYTKQSNKQKNNINCKSLEIEIDNIDENLSQLKSFIIPGGNTLISYCHIARCICRRAERKIINVLDDNQSINDCLKYINRLSDYLFILVRKFHKDLNIEEKLI